MLKYTITLVIKVTKFFFDTDSSLGSSIVHLVVSGEFNFKASVVCLCAVMNTTSK